MVIERQNKNGFVTNDEVREAIAEFFAENDYEGKRLLVIIPDNTRSGPVGDVFKIIYDCLGQKAKAVDCLVALGTHQPMTEEQICTRLGMTPSERNSKFARVKFFNHEWEKKQTFTSIGKISADEIRQISGGLFCEEVDVAINKLIFDYDEFFILGPVFPHEVVGFSGGHKYIFPGIAGDEIINFFHWLGAVITNPCINGNKWTPTRRLVEKAASFIKMPRKLFAPVSSCRKTETGAVENKLNGIFIGDCMEAWEKAAELSEKVHIVYKDKPYETILGIAPRMYDDIWTAGKVMYKLEPIIADGGMLIIYAPHISEISYTHGKVIDRIGYHSRDYFLKQMDKFAGVPRAVMAHSTHVKGIGTYIDGVEKPRVNVVLATGISRERCRKVNLGYINPNQIDIANYENKEDKGILVVHNAGETLYRLSSGYIPTIHSQ
jgi:nickel-dependent lactate racemase